MVFKRYFLLLTAIVFSVGFDAFTLSASTNDLIQKTPNGIQFVRTPEEAFLNIPDYPFEPNYVFINGLRIHYLDEGDKNAPLILLLHGEPSWSFLYRHMIPIFVNAGYRVIAPDLIGFGKSDKPISRDNYSYNGLVDIMDKFIRSIHVEEITLFAHDWGGLIGLRVVAQNPDRFARIIVANTDLPICDTHPDINWEKNPDATLFPKANFQEWLKYSQTVPDLPVGEVIQTSTYIKQPDVVIDAYDAPFPSELYKTGVRMLPVLVCTNNEENVSAWQVLKKWKKPFLTIWGGMDSIVPTNLASNFIENIPGAQGMPHIIIVEADHFLQEDAGEFIARIAIDFIVSNNKILGTTNEK